MNQLGAFQDKIAKLSKTLELVSKSLVPVLDSALELTLASFSKNGKLFACGNGGSAADAQHFCAELISSMLIKDRKALPAIALTTDTSILTAYSNDFSFDGVFARQIEALACENDVVYIFSTSGKSANCILAARAAKAKGAKIVTFSSKNSPISGFADCAIEVPSNNTQEIQEVHEVIYHFLAEQIEERLSRP